MFVGRISRSARMCTYWSRGLCRHRWRQMYSTAGLMFAVFCMYLFYTVQLESSNSSNRLPMPRNDKIRLIRQVHEKSGSDRDWESGSSLRDRISTRPPSVEMSGFERAAYLRTACRELQAANPVNYRTYIGRHLRVSYNEEHDALFCPMCKMASSFWTRLFQMLHKNRGNKTVAKTPFDIPLGEAPPTHLMFDVRRQLVTPSHNAASSFKFMFVRSPYSKLFSAYVDKILGPNPTMWTILGRDAIVHARGHASSVCSSDVTFEEYVGYAVHQYKAKRKYVDCHFNKYTECSPCMANHTFVGKMETFKTDTYDILAKLGQRNTLDVFKTDFFDLHAADAIHDSISSPFSWKQEISKCIPWPDALRRVWRKLQIRGVLDTSSFPLSDEEANATTEQDFINIVTKVREKASSAEKRTVKREAFLEAYSTVSKDILRNMAAVYSEELLLFAYDSLDYETIQNQTRQNRYKGYTNYLDDITVV